MRRKDGAKVPTNTYFLLFARPELPKEIKIGVGTNVRVNPYIPNPLRCFKCQKFGHPQSKCKGTQVCEHCGHPTHEGNCTQKPKCTNCKGEHAPNSRECPTFKKEKLIQSTKVLKRISFAEARKEVENSQEKSYALKAAAVTVNRIGSSKSCKCICKCSNTVPSSVLQPPAQHQAGNKRLTRAPQRVLKSAQRISRSEPSPRPKTGGTRKQAHKPAPKSSQSNKGGPPAPAPQAAGKEQVKKPASAPTPVEGPGKNSAPAHQAAESVEATKPHATNKEPSAQTPQAAEGNKDSEPPSASIEEVEMEGPCSSPIKGGAAAPVDAFQSPGRFPFDQRRNVFSPSSSDFRFQKSLPREKRRLRRIPPESNLHKEADKNTIPLKNRWLPFEDPEFPF